jgi:N-acetyl-anhydromuramyl-L-alanine amidase AmpD
VTRTAGFRWSDISVGIEQVHKHPNPYASNMVVGTKNLIERIRSAYGTSPHNVLGHGEIALHGPLNAMRIGRKLTCPGEAYDWYILESSGNATNPGSGIVPHARYDAFFINNPNGALNSGSGRASSVAVSGLQLTLAELGYFVKITGRYDEPTLRAVEAFQVRHFSGRFRSGQLSRIISKSVRLANLVTIQMMHDVLGARAGFRF